MNCVRWVCSEYSSIDEHDLEFIFNIFYVLTSCLGRRTGSHTVCDPNSELKYSAKVCRVKKFLRLKPVFLRTDRERGIWEHLVQPEPHPAGGEGERGARTAGGQPGEQGGHPQVTRRPSSGNKEAILR